MRKGIQIKTIRNLNLDHPGGKCRILTIRGGNEGVNPPRMVKIWHFPPGWSRFRFLMVLIWIPFLISPPDGQDLAQICSKCQLQFLRLMATPWLGGGIQNQCVFVCIYRHVLRSYLMSFLRCVHSTLSWQDQDYELKPMAAARL